MFETTAVDLQTLSADPVDVSRTLAVALLALPLPLVILASASPAR
jgi:hypothetical protein